MEKPTVLDGTPLPSVLEWGTVIGTHRASAVGRRQRCPLKCLDLPNNTFFCYIRERQNEKTRRVCATDKDVAAGRATASLNVWHKKGWGGERTCSYCD